MIASGSDARFFRCLQQLLLSLRRQRLADQVAVVLFDLGWTPAQRSWLRRRAPWAELRPLPLEGAPPHVSVLTHYAWKPTAIEQLVSGSRSPWLWLDSACVVTGSLQPVWRHLERHGVWVPFGGRGVLREDCHPAIAERLAVTPQEGSLRARAGGVGAFDGRRPETLQLLRAWRDACWQPELLLPPPGEVAGWRGRHHFDQTLLTLLLQRHGLDAGLDELDISSASPTPFLRSRNKVDGRWPLWTDPLLRCWFAAYRAVDVALWKRKLQRSGAARLQRP